MNYINFKCPYTNTIETVETLKGMTKTQKRELLNEYKLVSNNYYFSQRATKDYYQLDKEVK